MNRKEIINFCNEKIFTQCNSALLDAHGMRDAVKLVQKWRIGKSKNVVMTPCVVDGFLYMNGTPCGRITPKEPRPAFSEYSYYIEGRILSRAERDSL